MKNFEVLYIREYEAHFEQLIEEFDVFCKDQDCVDNPQCIELFDDFISERGVAYLSDLSSMLRERSSLEVKYQEFTDLLFQRLNTFIISDRKQENEVDISSFVKKLEPDFESYLGIEASQKHTTGLGYNFVKSELLKALARFHAVEDLKRSLHSGKIRTDDTAKLGLGKRRVIIKTSGIERDHDEEKNKGITLLNAKQTAFLHQLLLEKDTKVYLKSNELSTESFGLALGALTAFGGERMRKLLGSKLSLEEEEKEKIREILRKALEKLI